MDHIFIIKHTSHVTDNGIDNNTFSRACGVKLLPLPQPHLHTRTYAHTCQRTQRATQLTVVLARAFSVSMQNLKKASTTTVP
jgi:hypothetical protein